MAEDHTIWMSDSGGPAEGHILFRGSEAQTPVAFDIDQSTKDIDTDDFELYEALQDHGRWACTKTGWFSKPDPEDGNIPADEEFAIILSPGEGVIINFDLFYKLPFGKIYIGKLKYLPEKNEYHGYKFPMPTVQDPDAHIIIMGESYIPFFMEENVTGNDWTSFNAKVLLTHNELPILEPNYSSHARPLMWIGVGDDPEKSLFRLKRAGDPASPDANCGYAATREEVKAPDLV